jgi:CRISPR/Cas system-associated exonuclease Cas4 (RecB family)
MTTTELKNEFAWSWSRHENFYQCARKTYWQYYGSWNGWEPQSPPTAQLAYRLKQIVSVPMLVGRTLHEVVGERLRMRTDAGGPVPAPQIKDELERRILKRLRESRNRDWERFRSPKQYAMLFEDYYGPGFEDREREAALTFARSCVDGFAQSAYARRAFAIPKSRIRIVDPQQFDDMKFEVDGVRVFAAPDFVVEDEQGGLHIVDWKTGRAGKANVAQLSVYGLYVTEKLGAPLERITAHIVYLRTGEVTRYEHLREGVAEARRRISTYTADVRSRLTDVANNVAGDPDMFPMTDDRSLCRSCKFQEICGRVARQPEPPDEDDKDL